MDSTVRSPRDADDGAAPRWVLVIAHHLDPGRIGTALVVEDGVVELGRSGDGFGPGALEDATLSRRHSSITCASGALTITDHGSRNGTWVNGAAIRTAALAAGDVIELGDLLLLALRPALPPRPRDGLDGGTLSGAMAELLDAVTRMAAQPAPVLLIGDSGVGKSAVARALHHASGRAPLTVIPCGRLTLDRMAAEFDPMLARAAGGTVVLDGVDDAPLEVQAALRAVLDAHAMAGVDRDPDRAIDVRVIATARELAPIRADLANRLRYVVRIPPLRERREDLALLIRAQFTRAGRIASKRLVAAMLRYGWPGNGTEVAAVIERALLDAGATDPVALSPTVAIWLGVPPRPTEPAFSQIADAPRGGAAVTTIAVDGSWLSPAGGAPISLRRRENLSLVLGALCRAARAAPGQALSVGELFRAGWPDQRADRRAAAGRVYVALTALRNLGLRDILRRDAEGYLLAIDAGCAIVD